ncbi:hypothetical protein [Clostridium estertheticum]|uniref:hypothetical protein n=1 Tax=Clostridium estertheticum TaxID=238834 RepID=UPI001C0B8297|nr:hypothetical protein [Clostridium estertheticum]MBU3171339.1 hypothetical protein [Clostridium estertheticum]
MPILINNNIKSIQLIRGNFSGNVQNLIDGDENSLISFPVNTMLIGRGDNVYIYTIIIKTKVPFKITSINIAQANNNIGISFKNILRGRVNDGAFEANIVNNGKFYNEIEYSSMASYIGGGNGEYIGYLNIREIKIYGNCLQKNLMKQASQYYTIKSDYYNDVTHNFKPLTLTGGIVPNEADYKTYGFDDLNLLTQNMTVGTETFRPIDKFDKSKPLEIYKGVEK